MGSNPVSSSTSDNYSKQLTKTARSRLTESRLTWPRKNSKETSPT